MLSFEDFFHYLPQTGFDFSSKIGKKLKANIIFIFVSETVLKTKDKNFESLMAFSKQFDLKLEVVFEAQEFQGKWLETVSLLANPQVHRFDKIVLIGTGTFDNSAKERVRHAGIHIEKIAKAHKSLAHHIVITNHSTLFQGREDFEQMVMGVFFEKYSYFAFKKDKIEEKKKLKQLFKWQIIHHSFEENFHLPIISVERFVHLCRFLQDSPPNLATPEFIAQQFCHEAKKCQLKSTLLGKSELTKLRFDAMLAVANGSSYEPKVVILEHKPKKFQKTIAFVGKGLTMDTGGYSIKTPSTYQEKMKYDMCGAAVALSTVLMAKTLDLPVHVIGVGAFCENMIDSLSYRVDDILTSLSGKTIEVIDTDAEGRIVLSDPLFYTADKFKPDVMISLATLTGSIIATLGRVAAGAYTFDDGNLKELIETASLSSGEKLFVMPVWEEAIDDIKSDIADVRNVEGDDGKMGSIAGAVFLKEFTQDIPFVHLDIAGVANGHKGKGYTQEGSSGYGLMLSLSLIRALAKIDKS